MAGLEVLFASAAPTITCAQDALVCFLHWEVVTHGYYGLGAGDQVRQPSQPRARVEGVRCLLPEPRGPSAWSLVPGLPSSPSPGTEAYDTIAPYGLQVREVLAELSQPSWHNMI